MKISEALTKLRNLKSQVARIEKYIDDSIIVYEDTTPEYEYMAELSNREALINSITALKTRIQITNATTKVNYGGTEMTLSELILINADLRSELAFQQKLLKQSLNEVDRWSKRTKEDVKRVFAPGYNKAAIRKLVANLEAEKEKVEGVLNAMNQATDLMDK